MHACEVHRRVSHGHWRRIAHAVATGRRRRWNDDGGFGTLLASPLFAGSIALLVINDHVPKAAWPGLITGSSAISPAWR